MIIAVSFILIPVVFKMQRLSFPVKMMIIGAIILATGIGTMFLIPFTARAIAREWTIKIRKSSISYREWSETKGPNVVQFHVFNLTNPYEFVRGEKAVLEQVGPFAYSVRAFKDDLLFHGKNRVSYSRR